MAELELHDGDEGGEPQPAPAPAPAPAPPSAPAPAPARPARRARGRDDDRDDRDDYVFGRPTAPSKRVRQQRADEQYLEVNETLDSILEELDIKAGEKWKFTLNRVSPAEDPVTGANIKGWTADYENEPPTQALIEEKFGGGVYDLQIRGPRPGEHPAWGLITQHRLTIAGEPIPKPPKRRPGQQAAPGAAQGFDAAGIVQQLTTASREQQQELIRFMQSNNGNGQQSEFFTLMMKMLDPARSQQQIEMERKAREEERKQDRLDAEALRKHERELAEDARKRERQEREDERKAIEADRKAEREAAAAKAQHEREMEKLRFAAEKAEAEEKARIAIAQAEANAKLQIAALQAQTEQQAKAMALQIEAMKTQAASERAFATELNKSTQDVQSKLLAVTNEASKTQLTFMMEQLKDARALQIKDPTKELINTIDLVDRIRGGAGEEGEHLAVQIIKEGADAVSKVAPGLFAAVGIGASAAKKAEREAAKKQAQIEAEVEEGSVAVLDGERRVRKLRKPVAKGQVVDAQVVSKETKPAEKQEKQEAVEPTANDLIDFVFPSVPPSAQLDMQVIELLVKNVDYAIKKNMEAKDILEKVVKRFPTSVVDYLRDVEIEQMIEQLDNLLTIQGWAINSLSGQEKLRQVHRLMQAA